MAALALLAVPATAAVSVTAYEITSDLPASPSTAAPAPGPSTLVSGAHPDAGSYSVFNYPNATEDLRTAITNFGPGLLGNPESVPKCPQAALEAGGSACPAGSQIGTSRLDVGFAGSNAPLTSFSGKLYNAELLGSEPGRLAAVTVVGPNTLVSSIPFFITPRGNGDYGLTGILTDIARLDAPPPNFQSYALSFIINGSQNGYVRNPTSCEQNVSTGQASGWDDTTVAESPAYSFATFNCQQLPFAPKVSLTIGERGETGFNQHPPFVFKLTQAPGEADVMGNKLTLPVELNSNNGNYQALCTPEQANSGTCPAGSKFGTATATSPFLGEPIQGPVYLIQQTTASLPGLLIDLQGRANVRLQTRTSLVGKQFQSLILNAPQLPVSELTVSLNGGQKSGVFVNREDLCLKGNSKTKFNSVTALTKEYGWNGKQTGDDKITATVVGCGPAVKARLKRATSTRPSLTITATRHPDAPNMKELRVTLGSRLSLSKSKLSNGSASAAAGASLKYVNRHTFKVTGLPAAGAAKVTIRLSKGAVKVSSRTRRALKKGRSRGFNLKVSPTPVSGKGTTTKTKFRVKGRR